jgi:hypothetical protein
MSAIDRRLCRLEDRFTREENEQGKAWPSLFGRDVGGAYNRVANRLMCGHANVLLMIRIDLYRLLTSCGVGVGASTMAAVCSSIWYSITRSSRWRTNCSALRSVTAAL